MPVPPGEPLHVLLPRRGGFGLHLREVWEFRDLLVFLTWRDLKVRYRQTVLGAAWAVIQPLTTMVIFSLIFGRLAGLPSEGVPYPVFTFAALLPWTLFSTVLVRMSASVVSNSGLVSKIYFPRVLIPLSSLGSVSVDFLIQFGMLLLLMAYYDLAFTWRLLALPALTLLALGTSTAVGLWLAALNVKYRDVNYVVPFFVQIWQFVSPVAYSATLVAAGPQWPQWVQQWLPLVYSLNPLVGVIEGFRWALLSTTWTPGPQVALSVVIVVLGLTASLVYFQRAEHMFADVV